MTSSKRKFSLRYEELSDCYILRSGQIRLESDNANQFSIRKNELKRLPLNCLPVSIKFILQDETLMMHKQLVSVKIILEKIGTGQFSITVEESSQSSRWKSSDLMNSYYDQVCEYLIQRQRVAFDIIVEEPKLDEYYFFIQYKLKFTGGNPELLLKICRIITKEVHKLSEQINNQQLT